MQFKSLQPPQIILRLLILVEICCEMTILQQVAVVVIFMPYFFGQSLRKLCVVIAQIWSSYQGASKMFQRSTSKEGRHGFQ